MDAALQVVERGKFLADHRLHQVDPQQLRGEVLPHQLPVAQHGEPVADLVDLVEEVADEQDRDAGLLQRADHPEQLGDLLEVEAGGGLVQDQHLRLDVDGAGDRHQLLDGQRVGVQQGVGVDVEAEAFEDLCGPTAHRAPVDAAEASRLASEQDVLRHGEVPQQVDLLVHRADPGGLRLGRLGEGDLLAAQPDHAAVDAVDAGECLDQGGLAGTVLPHQRVHLAGEHPEVDPVQGLDSGETDRDVGHLDDRGLRGDRRFHSVRHRCFLLRFGLTRTPVGAWPGPRTHLGAGKGYCAEAQYLRSGRAALACSWLNSPSSVTMRAGTVSPALSFVTISISCLPSSGEHSTM